MTQIVKMLQREVVALVPPEFFGYVFRVGDDEDLEFWFKFHDALYSESGTTRIWKTF